MSACGMRLFFGLFLLVGASLTYALLGRPLVMIVKARGFTPTNCVILSSQVVTSASSKGSSTYRIEMSYKYRVGGREYRSDRYDWSVGSTSGRASKEAVVERYPEGSEATCYVNPRDPTDAVINRDFEAVYLVGLFPMIFFVVGLVGVLSTFRKGGVTVTLPEARRMAAAARAPQDSGAGRGEGGAAGSKVLTTDPRGNFKAALIGTILWNGLVTVIALVGGREAIVPILIMGALGVALVGVTIRPLTVAAGEELLVSWSFAGDVTRIDRLSITLIGKEKATYRRGTKNASDTDTFATVPLFETTGHAHMAQGEASLQVPLEAMPTWSGSHNSIFWELSFRGAIARWPDVAVGCDITIRPAPPPQPA